MKYHFHYINIRNPPGREQKLGMLEILRIIGTSIFLINSYRGDYLFKWFRHKNAGDC